MFQDIFFSILNMSLTGTAVIAVVLVLRLVLRRAPRIFSYSLWAVVLFRLLCPVSFSLPVSWLGAVNAPVSQQGVMNYIPEDFFYEPEQGMDFSEQEDMAETGGQEIVRDHAEGAENEMFSANREEGTGFSVKDLAEIAGILWGMGMLAMLLYGGISLAVFKRRLKGARRAQAAPDLYYLEGLPTSFVLGVIRPRIYLPEGISEAEQRYVLLHERIHIRRGDHILRMVSYLTLCIHWFNPLVWAAFILSGRDMEMSCDEAVIRKLGSGVKQEYSASLLSMAAGRRIFPGTPLAFGEGNTGGRIRNVLKYKKPGTVLVCLTAIVGIIAAVFLLANPAAEEAELKEMEEITEGLQTAETDSETGQMVSPVSEPDASSEEEENREQSQESEFDLREAFPSYDTEEPQRQREILQSLERGEALTLERLKELLEEPEPLLESYAGYQDTEWYALGDGDGDDCLIGTIHSVETGGDYELSVHYDASDNRIHTISLERLNDRLGLQLYTGDYFYYGYNPRAAEQIDDLNKGAGELFLWIRRYAFPASNENNIYVHLYPDEFRTDLGDGDWSGMLYQWRDEEEWAMGSSEWGHPEWRAAAAIMQIPADRLVFTDGVLADMELHFNHAEPVGEWESLEDCEEQALICLWNADQYTLSELDEAERAGTPIPEEYHTADIWYVCIGREDSPWGYLISMNSRHFTREEAAEFVRSIWFRDAAWE